MRRLRTILGIPYFKFLKRESRERGSDVSRADFARMQREALENYLIGLIRAVVGISLWSLFLIPDISADVPPHVESPHWFLGNFRALHLPCQVWRRTV